MERYLVLKWTVYIITIVIDRVKRKNKHRNQELADRGGNVEQERLKNKCEKVCTNLRVLLPY
jgi:hypothetical protein